MKSLKRRYYCSAKDNKGQLTQFELVAESKKEAVQRCKDECKRLDYVFMEVSL
jgi:hypothetical protein